MTTRALVAGCGYVGSRLGELLAEHGAKVWGLRRSPHDLPQGVEGLAADLLAPETLRGLPKQLDWVFYTAAASSGDPAAYEAIYQRGLENLLAALVAQGQTPQRVLFTSSTGVYGQSDGGWIDEASPAEPARPGGRHILAGENALLASRFSSATVRFSGIYGPGRTRLIEQVRSGRARQRPGPPSWTNRIHRDDCAGILAHLARRDRVDPVYIGSDSAPVPYNEVLSWLAEQLDVPEPPLDGGDRGERQHTAGQNKRCSNERILRSGYHFRYPSYREGYRALLERRD